MDTIFNAEDDHDAKLRTPLAISEIMDPNGCILDLNFDDMKDRDEDDIGAVYDRNVLIDMANFECLGVHDEETYDDSEPFEVLADKMENVDAEGMVKKRILRKGYGDVVPEKSVVYIHYNVYVEYNEEPIDSSYARKRSHSFRLGSGEILFGLDVGVKTMLVNEKAQFLVDSKYAYGPLGCFDRVPASKSYLFEVELLKYVNSGAAASYENLPEDVKTRFEEILKRALALCEKGNDLVTTKKNPKAAIRDYNQAVHSLESCRLADYDDQEKQQKLLLRLYTNLAVCYNKMNLPKKCCINCNNIYKLCQQNSLKVPIKVFYNNARALMALNDLKGAERKLRMAAAVERDNMEIVRCYLDLDKMKEAADQREKEVAKMMMGNPEVSEEFKSNLTSMCVDLKNDPKLEKFDLPAKLSKKEVEFAKIEAEKFGFNFERNTNSDVEKYLISKAVTEKK